MLGDIFEKAGRTNRFPKGSLKSSALTDHGKCFEHRLFVRLIQSFIINNMPTLSKDSLVLQLKIVYYYMI